MNDLECHGNKAVDDAAKAVTGAAIVINTCQTVVYG